MLSKAYVKFLDENSVVSKNLRNKEEKLEEIKKKLNKTDVSNAIDTNSNSQKSY